MSEGQNFLRQVVAVHVSPAGFGTPALLLPLTRGFPHDNDYGILSTISFFQLACLPGGGCVGWVKTGLSEFRLDGFWPGPLAGQCQLHGT